VLASLALLTPLGALAGLAVAAPLAALAWAERRSRRVAAAIGLRPASARPLVVRAALIATTCGLLAAAAAQPVWQTTTQRTVRADAQAFVVVDVSRSMLAAGGPNARTRLEAARRVARTVRDAIGDVPTGLAGMTDRVLPYLLPTADPTAFERALQTSVQPEAPPPADVNAVATTFGALGVLGTGGFFTRAAAKRLCIVVTDGETRPFSAAGVAASLSAGRGCRLIVVRVGANADRIWGTTGRAEAAYRPLPTAAADVERLVTASNGRAFGAGEEAAAGRTARALSGTGPTTHVGLKARAHPFAQWLAALSLLPALALIAIELATLTLRKKTHVFYDAVS
jgi:hypothetical protein